MFVCSFVWFFFFLIKLSKAVFGLVGSEIERIRKKRGKMGENRI